MSSIHLIGVLQPKIGRFDQIKRLFSELAEKVLEHADGCHEYSVYVQAQGKDGLPNDILHERYDNQAALDAHLQTPYFLNSAGVLQKDDLLRVPLRMEEVFVEPIAGHALKR